MQSGSWVGLVIRNNSHGLRIGFRTERRGIIAMLRMLRIRVRKVGGEGFLEILEPVAFRSRVAAPDSRGTHVEWAQELGEPPRSDGLAVPPFRPGSFLTPNQVVEDLLGRQTRLRFLSEDLTKVSE